MTDEIDRIATKLIGNTARLIKWACIGIAVGFIAIMLVAIVVINIY